MNVRGNFSKEVPPFSLGKLGFIGELTAMHKLTMTTISVGTGVLDGPETIGVDILYGDVKTF